jgi:hypothetical protein
MPSGGCICHGINYVIKPIKKYGLRTNSYYFMLSVVLLHSHTMFLTVTIQHFKYVALPGCRMQKPTKLLFLLVTLFQGSYDPELVKYN